MSDGFDYPTKFKMVGISTPMHVTLNSGISAQTVIVIQSYTTSPRLSKFKRADEIQMSDILRMVNLTLKNSEMLSHVVITIRLKHQASIVKDYYYL